MSLISQLSRRTVRTCLDVLRLERRIVLTRAIYPLDTFHIKFAHTSQNVLSARTDKEKKRKPSLTYQDNNTKVARTDTEGEEDLFRKLKDSNKPPTLSETVTPELEKRILEDSPNQSFVLRQALVEIRRIEERKKILFVLPESLTIDEWRTLISLVDYRVRMQYLLSIQLGDTDLQEIRRQDEVYCNPLQISEEMIEEAVGDDQEKRKRIKMFLMHHEMQRQEGVMVPYRILATDLAEIARLNSMNGHQKFITFLFKTELSKFNEDLRKKSSKTIQEEQQRIGLEKKMSTSDHLVYGLGHNTFNHRLNKSTTNIFHNWNAVKEFYDWGIPLVIDMSHHNTYRTTSASRKSLFTEIINSISLNRTAETPFQLHITGMNEECMSLMKKYYETGLIPEAPCNITSKSHLDIFPTERLVYLSPDSNNDLKKFDPNDIYVVGGIIDKTDEKLPLTLSVAKRLNIRHARFPMRQTIGLVGDLNVDTCVAIMNDLKTSQDWFYSLRWVPSRHFGNRFRSSNDPEHQRVYRAHRNLSPTSSKGEDEAVRNLSLNSVRYRNYYEKIKNSTSREEMEAILEELKI